MLIEAFPIAAAGAIYPIAFAVIVTLLGGVQPMRRSLVFLVGGMIVSILGYAVIIALLRSLDLTPRVHPAVSATIKIAIGVALLALAVRTLWRRHRRSPVTDSPADEPEKAADTKDEPPRSLWRVFVTGALVYFPGVFLIASARELADANSSVALTGVAALICVILLLAIVEVPIIAFAVSPERVQPGLQRINHWARAHSNVLILAIELVGGLYLLATGIEALVNA